MKQSPWIAPSLLAANSACFGQEAQSVLTAGAHCLHFDVMDNHFVPNLSFGPAICQGLRDFGISAPIDVHLMTSPYARLIDAFAKAGASMISIHAEADGELDQSLQHIRAQGCQAGLAFNPATPLDQLEHTLPLLDYVLIMSVQPGFGGQAFIPSSLEKISQARRIIDAQTAPIRLEVDGGVNQDNIQSIAQAGADTFVAGSAIFKSDDYQATIQSMLQAIQTCPA
jgi:ribulose-phosphate 3-epimerase